jgi:probable F420-dependent oxidoreductase
MGELRSFRFGVIGESIRSARELLATARRAEALGYSTLLLRDHLITEPFGDQLAPLVALAAAASATVQLRVGTLVIDNDFHHPALLAKEVATLDELSGGRVELGLGAGWLRAEYQRAGIPFDRAGVRIDRLAESVRIIKQLWEGKPVTAAGAHYRLEGLTSFPPPVQRPHPPVLIGGASRRILTLAGGEADIVGLMSSPALPDGTLSPNLTHRRSAALDQRVGWVAEGAGDRFGEVELSAVVTPHLGADHRAVAERISSERGWGPDAAEVVLDMPTMLLGPLERVTEQAHALRDHFGITYLVVSDRDLETFAPVVERLAG